MNSSLRSPQKFTIETLEELRAVASTFASRLKTGDRIALKGELGAGKTTFVAFLAAELGSTDPVSSPTYVLEHRYRLPSSRAGITEAPSAVELQHWDLYRLSGCPEELLDPPGVGVMQCIEWAERAPELLVTCQHLVILTLQESGLRTIEIHETGR